MIAQPTHSSILTNNCAKLLLKKIIGLIIGFIYAWIFVSCENHPATQIKPPVKKVKLSKLAQIKHDGVLRVLTHIDPTTYYPVAKGYAGLDYDLVTLFAQQLGVKVEFQVVEDFDDLLNQIAEGKADIAAAGLSITPSRKKRMRFSPAYHEVVEQVIYRSGTYRPRKPADLNLGILEVVNGSSHIDTLRHLKRTVAPKLTWTTNKGLDTNKLIGLVNEGLIDYTLADSTQALLTRRFYPKLHIAFDIGHPREIAWALPLSTDNSLYHEVNIFFAKIKKDKSLAQLLERYYGHADTLDYVNKCKFYEYERSRLPLYKKYFKKAAKQHNLDWRLLAAIGYQESHWEESAVSPTGVRGIMMLTQDTAQQLGVKDRTDPEQSIHGGAVYFKQRLKRIPLSIPEPDHTWFALAAYNIGFAHLEDARDLTKKQGGNPDKWMDVKKFLPLLAHEYWYSQTVHGYARGYEPIVYVENIRNYYDLLVWLTTEKPIIKQVGMVQHSRTLKERAKRIYQRILNSKFIKDLKLLLQTQQPLLTPN